MGEGRGEGNRLRERRGQVLFIDARKLGRMVDRTRVIAVDTAQVTIELNKDLKSMTRTRYEGALEVGRFNSYVILPVGARKLVAMVTPVVLAEEAEIRADRTMVALPAARRVMRATLIGTLDGRAFTQGISSLKRLYGEALGALSSPVSRVLVFYRGNLIFLRQRSCD